MNLSEKEEFKISKDSIENFRRKQYDLIPDFIEMCIKYISNQSKDYLKITSITFEDKIDYNDIYYSAVKQLIVKVINTDLKENKDQKETEFLNVFIPKLVHDNFFYLNGNYYAPALYLFDKPFSFKEKSIMISTLFNSMSFMFKKNIITFTGINIPLHIFLLLFLYNDPKDQVFPDFINLITTKYNKKFKMKIEPEDHVINYFTSRIDCENNVKSILKHFDKLMFDPYTTYSLSVCYDIPVKDINIVTIVRKLFEMDLNNEYINFIDLKHKRLIFIELLLRPIFKKFSSLAIQTVRGFKFSQLKMDRYSVLKNFSGHLKNNFLYDTGNLYSGLLQHKVSLLSPGVTRGPKSISSIHDSHFGKICPVTISSMEPGKIISIIPGTEFDDFGLFKDF